MCIYVYIASDFTMHPRYISISCIITLVKLKRKENLRIRNYIMGHQLLLNFIMVYLKCITPKQSYINSYVTVTLLSIKA